MFLLRLISYTMLCYSLTGCSEKLPPEINDLVVAVHALNSSIENGINYTDLSEYIIIIDTSIKTVQTSNCKEKCQKILNWAKNIITTAKATKNIWSATINCHYPRDSNYLCDELLVLPNDRPLHLKKMNSRFSKYRQPYHNYNSKEAVRWKIDQLRMIVMYIELSLLDIIDDKQNLYKDIMKNLNEYGPDGEFGSYAIFIPKKADGAYIININKAIQFNFRIIVKLSKLFDNSLQIAR